MKTSLLVLIYFFVTSVAQAQPLTDSNLPIIIIQTDSVNGQPVEIPDDPKVHATMKLIYRPDGSRNYVNDAENPEYVQYNADIKIELRGSTSQLLPKKPYSLTTIKPNGENNNVSLLGLPKENDWVLNALAYDASLIRDVFSYENALLSGNYAARGVYCEVIVNGDYKGLYVFMEKLKADSDRINIEKMEDTDNFGVSVTGGYITKADKTTGGDPVAWVMNSYNGISDFIHEHPKPEDVTEEQNAYIRSVFLALEKQAGDHNDDPFEGYTNLIDLPSFIDFILVNELAGNVDAYQFSTFFHKDRGGKLRAGPIWDFNLTYGNDLTFWGLDRSFTNVWQFDNGDNTGPKFWKDLYDSPEFKCRLNKRWQTLTGSNGVWNQNHLFARIDSLVDVISEAAEREQIRWETVGNHDEHISAMKTWIQQRLTWMNAQLSDTSCDDAVIPKIIITEINYNPVKQNDYTSNQLEFIGLSNAGVTAINLRGMYLRNLGVSYQFRKETVLLPNETVYIASDSLAVADVFGIHVVGEFARNLSNKSQILTLALPTGELVDSVRYYDSGEWPEAADGNGFYLSLSDWDSDNALAENWETKVLTSTASELTQAVKEAGIYPNPVENTFKIKTSATIQHLEVFDVNGRLIQKQNSLSRLQATVDMQSFPTGIYFVRIYFTGNQLPLTQKVVKIR